MSGANCNDVAEGEGLGYAAGHTVGNEMSSRKWQRVGGMPWWIISQAQTGH